MQWKLVTQWNYTWVSNSINETKIKTLRNSKEYKNIQGGFSFICVAVLEFLAMQI